ncbi:Hint domain-containing protein [Litoreibacter albidus]|uniref:Hint domain-containing protein n=1 Tax=Litoreibacter albidus TaxID=670155 RepID=A0A1H3B6N7_9RHOB|nr:Hint domain-containing protein [Litoreibacter albidus]SDX37328.1 Hint domain-containing protein [Litoreibacter albidus]
MATQLTGTQAVLVSETDASTYFVGGPFSLGTGPFTDLAFSADDDETDFASFGAQHAETFGAGRQTGSLTNSGGGTYDQGLASLDDVLTITHPVTGAEILVGRVTLRVDSGDPGGGAQLQDFFIFSGPIDPNVSYTVTAAEYTPGASPEQSYAYSEFSGGDVVCFCSETAILTPSGPRAVDDIGAGDLVQTADNGVQPVLWVGRRTLTAAQLAANRKYAPVLIATGALGNTAPLVVSQQHRLLLGNRFVKAKHLVDAPRIPARLALGKRRMSYIHLLLEDHQVLFANGAGAESLLLGPMARNALSANRMGPHPQADIKNATFATPCRPMIKRYEMLSPKASAAP